MIPLLLAIGALLLALALWLVPRLQVRPLRWGVSKDRLLEMENELRKTFSQLVGGFLVLGGLLFTWLQISQARQHEITETYTNAIGYLESKEAPVRVGGIYALGKIIRDSPRDESTIRLILTAFVRANFAWAPAAQPREQVPVDLQAALSTIGGQRTLCLADTLPSVRLDLSQVDLRGVNLVGLCFRSVRFVAAHFDAASLSGVDMRDTELNGANLDQADLTQADMRRALLTGASLRETILEGANLEGARGLSSAEIRRQASIDSLTKLPKS